MEDGIRRKREADAIDEGKWPEIRQGLIREMQKEGRSKDDIAAARLYFRADENDLIREAVREFEALPDPAKYVPDPHGMTGLEVLVYKKLRKMLEAEGLLSAESRQSEILVESSDTDLEYLRESIPEERYRDLLHQKKQKEAGDLPILEPIVHADDTDKTGKKMAA